jgi:hypothetical protein
MTRAARWAYVILAWAFLLGLLAQVFVAGLGMFAGDENWETHIGLGWTIHLLPLLVLLAAWLSRAGRRHWQWALALAAVVFVIPIFALFRADTPVLAALHPVGAMIAAWLAIVVARQSLDALRSVDVREASATTA